MANSKIIFGGQTLIDLTGDTVTAQDVKSGVTFHDKAGEVVTGTNTFDADTSEDTAAVAEILVGKTAHARGALLTGTMPNNGAVAGTISSKDELYTVAQGYHDGSGKVAIADAEQAKIIPANIKSGVQILGVEGAYNGEEVTAQAKNVTPSTTAQTITPDSGYDYLSEVTVAAIPYTSVENSAGGMTITIG